MKYFSLVSVVILLLLSGCKVEFVSRADNNKVYATGSACGESKEQTKRDAVYEIIKNYPLIAEDLEEYISVHKVKGEAPFCYEAVITRKKWSLYTSDFQDEKEEIISHSTEYVSIFEYNDKDVLTNTLLTERRRFNEMLKTAKTLAPMDVEPFPDDFISLEDSINVLPSVKINVRTCNNNKNYKCDVKFFTDIKDESKKMTYMWDFGEGSKSDKKNAVHRYETEGRYSVSLQVTDASGLSTFRVKDILVTKSEQKQKVREESSVNGYFILKKKSYKVNENIYFDNRSSAKGSKIKEYSWDLGDGEASTVRNPQHSYKKPGKYVVKYKVCNTANDCAYASSSVNVVAVSKKAKPVYAKKPTAKPVTKPSDKATKKPVKKEQKAPIVKAAGIDAKLGEPIQGYIARKGPPLKKIVKKNASMTAYQYGNVWLLVKRDKIECAVQENAFSTSLMGNPKKCRWHKKNKKKSMVTLKQ
ncbi:MAG: PKD domain-containing protein [Sulfurimonadaceae bacterium]